MTKVVQILHNPTAGDGQHSKENLIKIVHTAGYDYQYVSTDDNNWKDFSENNIDFILLAGGDGTVRKLAKQLLKKMPYRQIPIHLLPLGTANNIAQTLKKAADSKVSEVDFNSEIINFDCGQIEGLDENYFIESIGMGIFPELIAKMDKKEYENENTSEKLKRTLKVFLETVKNFKAQKAKIKADGLKIQGSFLMVELMNIKSVGPNFLIAPNADPGDGFFDLALIPEENRSALEDYIELMIKGQEDHIDLKKFVKIIRVQNVKMKWKGTQVHVDDKLIKDYSQKSFTISIKPAAMGFLK